MAVAKRSKTIVVEAYLYVSLLETIQVATRLKQKVMYQAIAELYVHYVCFVTLFLLFDYLKKRRNVSIKSLNTTRWRNWVSLWEALQIDNVRTWILIGMSGRFSSPKLSLLDELNCILYSSLEIQIASFIYFSLLKKSVRLVSLPDECNNNVFWTASKNITSLPLVLCDIYCYAI